MMFQVITSILAMSLLLAFLDVGIHGQVYTLPPRSRGESFPLPPGQAPIPPWYPLSTLPQLLSNGAVHPPASTLLVPIPSNHARILNDRNPPHVFSRQFPIESNPKNPIKIKISGIKGSTVHHPASVTTPYHQWIHPTHFPPLRVTPNMERHISNSRIPTSNRSPVIDLRHSHSTKPHHKNPSHRPQILSKEKTNPHRHRWPPFPRPFPGIEIEKSWPHRATQFDYYRDLSRMKPLHDEYNKYDYQPEYESSRGDTLLLSDVSGESEETINNEEIRKERLRNAIRKELGNSRHPIHEEDKFTKEDADKESLESFRKVCKNCGALDSQNPEYFTRTMHGNRKTERVHPHRKYQFQYNSYPKSYRSLWTSEEGYDDYENPVAYRDSSEMYTTERTKGTLRRTNTLPTTFYSREYDDDTDDEAFSHSYTIKQNLPKNNRKLSKSAEKYYQLEEALKTIVKENSDKASERRNTTKKSPAKIAPKEDKRPETFRNIKIFDGDTSNEETSSNYFLIKHEDSAEELNKKAHSKLATSTAKKRVANASSEWWKESTEPASNVKHNKSSSHKSDWKKVEQESHTPELDAVSYFDGYSDESYLETPDAHLETPEASFSIDDIVDDDESEITEPRTEILRVNQKNHRVKATSDHQTEFLKKNSSIDV